MNAKRLINAIKTTMQRIRRNLMSKKKVKIKVMNDFIINKKTMNAKTSEENKNNIQLILHRRVVNKFFENNH